MFNLFFIYIKLSKPNKTLFIWLVLQYRFSVYLLDGGN